MPLDDAKLIGVGMGYRNLRELFPFWNGGQVYFTFSFRGWPPSLLIKGEPAPWLTEVPNPSSDSMEKHPGTCKFVPPNPDRIKKWKKRDSSVTTPNGGGSL